MHEFSICRSIIDQVEAVAREHGARAVKTIVVGLGPLSGVHEDELRRAFPLASRGTAVHEARLQIRHQPLQWRCVACGAASESVSAEARCAACGGDALQLLNGDQIVVEHVELTT